MGRHGSALGLRCCGSCRYFEPDKLRSRSWVKENIGTCMHPLPSAYADTGCAGKMASEEGAYCPVWEKRERN